MIQNNIFLLFLTCLACLPALLVGKFISLNLENTMCRVEGGRNFIFLSFFFFEALPIVCGNSDRKLQLNMHSRKIHIFFYTKFLETHISLYFSSFYYKFKSSIVSDLIIIVMHSVNCNYQYKLYKIIDLRMYAFCFV